MKWWFGAVAAMAVLSVAQGTSLREIMQADLRASEQAKLRAGGRRRKNSINHPNCKNDNTKTEDRTCEASDDNNGKARCDNCVQSCHVWGDPHMVTFNRKCAVSVFFHAGLYPFWGVKNAKTEYVIWSKVEMKYANKLGTKPWIMKAYITDKQRDKYKNQETNLVANVADCVNQGDILFQDKRKLHSDLAIKNKKAPDMEARLTVKCRKKYGIFALEMFIEIADDDVGESSKVNNLPFPYPESTKQLWNDFGACVDPVSFGAKPNPYLPDPNNLPTNPTANENLKEECQRTSKMSTKAGRSCSCSMQCALWGDPHVNVLWQQSTRNSQASFQMPKVKNGLTNAESFLYQFQNKYAVMVEVDDCELINTVHIYAMKDSALKKLNRCDSKALDTDWLNSNDFEKFSFSADEECKNKTDTTKNTRKTIMWPGVSDTDYYDDGAGGGLNLGRATVTATRTVPVADNERDPQKCTSKAMQKSSSVSSTAEDEEVLYDVVLGTVNTIMKCHNRAGRGFRPYFNVCVDRANIVPTSLKGESVSKNGFEILRQLENGSQNSGWCTTGDFKQGGRGASIQASAFAYRQTPGTAQPFVLATDSTVA